ncbi:hypothetical protein PANDA_013716 [Ailuropoda melanoleuca]|uniref:Uncharacterized protein n=1 Tax=Ailuropoda melanoleuca TaxID=9646 RepID=D2HPK3_AILME|nr:hypothetical protein PANDA_013716 [Ailuropoda melanoleuca]
MSLHRTSGTPQGPGMVSGQHIPPIRAHSGTPGPASCGSTASPAIGSLANSLHLKMPSGGGMAPQSNMAESPLHLPALSPRRQVLTNGKPRFQVTQAGGMSGPHTLKPKQQEFGSPFPPNPGKAFWLLAQLPSLQCLFWICMVGGFMMLMNKAGHYGQGSKWERRPRTGLHIRVSGWKVEVKPLRQASSGDLGLREGELQRTGEPSRVAVAEGGFGGSQELGARADVYDLKGEVAVSLLPSVSHRLGSPGAVGAIDG